MGRSMSAVWIEAALNGPWGRKRQPLIPITVEEIVADGIAAAKSGAGIVHVHAYDAATGEQRDDWEIYARIIDGIRGEVDAIVYPTIPLSGSGYAGANAERRFAHVAELARRGLIEWTVIDPGSVNFVRYDQIGSLDEAFIYRNPPADLQAGMRLAREHRLHPGYAIYEPGFVRLGASLANHFDVPTPIYRFMFSDEFAWGFPPEPVYLGAYLDLLENCAAGAPWMIAGLGVDITGLAPHALPLGGHLRVGLEDAPWGTGKTNRHWVDAAVDLCRKAGRQPATAGDIRAALGDGSVSGKGLG